MSLYLNLYLNKRTNNIVCIKLEQHISIILIPTMNMMNTVWVYRWLTWKKSKLSLNQVLSKTIINYSIWTYHKLHKLSTSENIILENAQPEYQ